MRRRLDRLRGLVLFGLVATGCADAQTMDAQSTETTDIDATSAASDDSSGDSRGADAELAEAEAWAPVLTADDPLRSHRPDAVVCPAGSWAVEDGTFEVRTGVCNYAAFGQLPVVPVSEDTQVRVVIAHEALWSELGAATAHVAVGLGRQVGAEATIAIPSGAGIVELTFDIESTPPPDAPLWLHLHNHGFNTWRVVSVTASERL